MRLLLTCAALLALLAPARALPNQDPPPDDFGESAKPADFATRLARNSYFKKIAYTTSSAYPPFEILIQKPAVPEPDYEAKVAKFYGLWMQELARVFDEQIAKPAKLEQPTKPWEIRLIVLLSKGDYLNYSETARGLASFSWSACYDDRIRSIVTYWDQPVSPNQKRFPPLRRLVWALLHQRADAAGGTRPALWLCEGVSGYLAWHVSEEPLGLQNRLIDTRHLDALVALAQDRAKQSVFLFPLATLASISSDDDAWRRVQANAKAASYTLQKDESWYDGFLYESFLWTAFLRREGATAHRAAFDAYLNACMKTANGRVDIEKAFAGIDLAALDREFFRWVYARYREVKKTSLDESALTTLFAAPTRAGASGQGFNPAAIAAQLEPPPDDLLVQHGLALRKLRAGDVEGAVAVLEKAIALAGDNERKPKLETELVRVRAWQAARDTWLGELAVAGGKVQVDRDGKKSSFSVARGAEGALTLQSAKGATVAITALEPASLAVQMKGTPAGSPEWARAYAYLVCDDARWDKVLRDKSAEAQALRADAGLIYPELQTWGSAAELLASLAADVMIPDERTATSVCQRIRKLTTDAPYITLVLDRRRALHALGEAACGKLYDDTAPPPPLAGKTSWIDADTIEIRYEFDSPAEIDDWPTAEPYLKSWRDIMTPITAPESARGFLIADGAWSGVGSFVFRHVLPLEAPFEVRFAMHHGGDPADDAPLGFFFLATCDDGGEHFLGVSDTGVMRISDAKLAQDVKTEMTSAATKFIGKSMAFELVHDGEKARLSHDGILDVEQPVLSRKSGDVVLLVHTSRLIALDSLTLRGKVGAAGKKKLRELWIASKLKLLGV